jgi:hypothetical protein
MQFARALQPRRAAVLGLVLVVVAVVVTVARDAPNRRPRVERGVPLQRRNDVVVFLVHRFAAGVRRRLHRRAHQAFRRIARNVHDAGLTRLAAHRAIRSALLSPSATPRRISSANLFCNPCAWRDHQSADAAP